MKTQLHKQNPFMLDCPPKDSIYAEAPKSTEYQSNVKYLRLPKGKFDDVGIFLNEYNTTKNDAKKTLHLAGLSERLRSNEVEMLSIIGWVPEAYLHASSNLRNDNEFLKRAINANPNVYCLLSKQQQQNKEIIDMYAQSMARDGGCKYQYIHDDMWSTHYASYSYTISAPLFKNSPSEKCNLDIFYSAENYEKIHELMLQNGVYHEEMIGNPNDQNTYDKYHPAMAYIQAANAYAANKPELAASYRLAEARNVENNIELLARIVERNVHSLDAQHVAEAAVRSEFMLKKEYGHSEDLIGRITEAETKYYIDGGKRLQKNLAAYNSGDKSLARFIDMDMADSATHSEMNVDPGMRRAWWEQRGDDLQNLMALENKSPWQMDDMAYLQQLASEFAEMRVGEQLEIQDFKKDPTLRDIEEIGKML